ncbi:hypothetical protein [Pseudoxanthomonas wuyuanensis]
MSARLLLLALIATALAACKADAPPAEEVAIPAGNATAAGVEPALSSHDAVAEVTASMDRFLAARSFHASMRIEGERPMTSEMEFAAPDRYRISLPVGTQIIIGDTMYMDMHGQRTRVPIPEGTISQWRDPLKIEQNLDGLSAEFLGNEPLHGTPARKYQVRHSYPEPGEFTYWIGADGLPLQLRHSGQGEGGPYVMTLRYSRYNDPGIRVVAPE